MLMRQLKFQWRLWKPDANIDDIHSKSYKYERIILLGMANVSGMSCNSLSLVMSAIGPSKTTGLINPAIKKILSLLNRLSTREHI